MKHIVIIIIFLCNISYIYAITYNHNSYVMLRSYHNTINYQNPFKLYKLPHNTNIYSFGLINGNYLLFNNYAEGETNVRAYNNQLYTQNNSSNNRIDFFLDEFYIRNNLNSNLYFTAGRQKITTQYAYFFNPLNVLTRSKDSFLPFADKQAEYQGQDTLGAHVNYNNTNYHIVYIPNIKYNNYTINDKKDLNNTPNNQYLLLKISGFNERINADFSLIYLQGFTKNNNTVGFGINKTVLDNMVVYNETTMSNNSTIRNTKKLYYRNVIGINYTLFSTTNLILEYYSNNTAYKYKEIDHNIAMNLNNVYNNHLPYFLQNYFALRLQQKINTVSIETGAITNIDDLNKNKGIIVFAGLDYSFLNNFNIASTINYFVADSMSEYNFSPNKMNTNLALKYFF